MMSDFEPFEIIEGDLTKGLILLCDHARNTVPAEYGSLGLPDSEFERHIAYDIGAEEVTRRLAKRLCVPAILTTYSRLLIDPNRGEDDPTLIRQLYDGTIISGNYPIDSNELEKRAAKYHRPYHQAIEKMCEKSEGEGVIPALCSIHTMTDKWNGNSRPWQTSILWDKDPRMALPMLEKLGNLPNLVIGNNEPYDGALGGDSMFRHGTAKGRAHALIEIRQDLVKSDKDIENWVDIFSPIIESVNSDPHIHEHEWFGTRTDGSAKTEEKLK